MRTRIRLLPQPKSMRSIIDATRREQWCGSAWNWWVNRDVQPNKITPEWIYNANTKGPWSETRGPYDREPTRTNCSWTLKVRHSNPWLTLFWSDVSLWVGFWHTGLVKLIHTICSWVFFWFSDLNSIRKCWIRHYIDKTSQIKLPPVCQRSQWVQVLSG